MKLLKREKLMLAYGAEVVTIIQKKYPLHMDTEKSKLCWCFGKCEEKGEVRKHEDDSADQLDWKINQVQWSRARMLSCSVVSNFLQPHGLVTPCQAPLSMESSRIAISFFRGSSWFRVSCIPDPCLRRCSGLFIYPWGTREAVERS